MVAPPPPASSRRRVLELVAALAALGLGAAAGLQAAKASREKAESERHRPVQVSDEEYVSSAECRSCHPSQYESWFNSYHRTMTQVASPASVLGDFDDVELSGYRLLRDGDGYYVDMPPSEGSGAAERARITLVTGSHHLQIYWYETGVGRALGQLPFAYLKDERRWVPRRSVFLEPPGDMRPTEHGRWNSSCIACHTTQGRPRADAQGEYDTHVAEFGIACEACHGPGREHVTKHASPLERYRSHFGENDDATIVHPGKLDHERASEVCSQCHAMWQHLGNAGAAAWNQYGFSYRPGADPAKSMWLLQPTRKDDERNAWVAKTQPRYVEGQFWRDGTARVSGREFSGMIESPCFERGELSCLSCHTMHKPADDPRPFASWAADQLAVGMDGDRACLQCHSDYAGRLTEHTRHPASSEGSRCMNCHMPYTSYGLLKAMRSHRIEVPDVRATVESGRPNACTSCHLDRTLAWAADELQKHYGIAAPELDDEQRSVEASLLMGVKGDAGQRALVAWAAGWPAAVAASPRADLPALLGVLMDDPYDAVRYIAERSLRGLPGVDTRGLTYDYVQRPHTREPVAARVAALGGEPLTAAERARVQAAIAQLMPGRDERPVLLLE